MKKKDATCVDLLTSALASLRRTRDFPMRHIMVGRNQNKAYLLSIVDKLKLSLSNTYSRSYFP